MRRICSECGAEFNGRSRDTRCPICRKIQHPVEREHICKQCGATYKSIASRTYFCQACADERRKEARKRCYYRKKIGSARLLGSTDLCTICGSEYIVASGKQEYCPACAERIRAEYNRAHAVNAYYNGGKKRRSERTASRATATEKCVVCGKEFQIIDARTLCCSPECSEIHALNLRKKWASENEERIRETNRKRWAESRGGVVRQLMRLGLKALNENTDQGEDGGTAG